LKWKVIYPIRHGHSYTSDYEAGVREALLPLSGREFWDVGANTGHYALMFAKNFDRVRAFEPNPDAIDILNLKITKKRIQNVEIVPIALSDAVGNSRLYLHTEVREKTIGSSNSLIPSSNAAGRGSDERNDFSAVPFVEVQTDTVDHLLGRERIELMKIDVEGAEFMVLNGAMKALDEGRIANLMIELHNADRKDELDSFLTTRHYKTKWLDFAPGAVVSRVFATLSRQ
jgi:FkbM family methyltransferase